MYQDGWFCQMMFQRSFEGVGTGALMQDGAEIGQLVVAVQMYLAVFFLFRGVQKGYFSFGVESR